VTETGSGGPFEGPFEGGDPQPDRRLRRRLRDLYARELPMGVLAKSLLKPLSTVWYVECVDCGRDLTDPGTTYYVERAIRGGEPMYEFALCETCLFDYEDEFSAESIRAIGDFWLEHANLEDRDALVESTENADALLERCLLNGGHRDALEEYQVFAWCRDGRLICDAGAPGLLSGAVIEELIPLLSRKTRDTMDDFIRDNLGLPPELQNLPVFV